VAGRPAVTSPEINSETWPAVCRITQPFCATSSRFPAVVLSRIVALMPDSSSSFRLAIASA
jgi:hypothetical protein